MGLIVSVLKFSVSSNKNKSRPFLSGHSGSGTNQALCSVVCLYYLIEPTTKLCGEDHNCCAVDGAADTDR